MKQVSFWLRAAPAPALVLSLWLAMPVAAAAAELAVLHPEPLTGQGVLLPLRLPPAATAGQDSSEDGSLEALQDVLAPPLEAAVQACRERAGAQDEDAPLLCPVPAALVAAHYGLPAVPGEWHDVHGRRHTVQGGLYFSHAAGSGVGFLLAGQASGPVLAGTVFSSDGGARFLRPHTVPAARWKAWPELAAQTRDWAREHDTRCQGAPACLPAARLLGQLDRLKGDASEYRLSSGARLQMLGAASRPQPRPGDSTAQSFVRVKLWRWVGRDGRAQGIEDPSQWFSSVEAESTACETQCSWQWDSGPEIFEFAGRVFVFGAYAGGTVHGYQFIEVLPRRIRPLGGYRWGS